MRPPLNAGENDLRGFELAIECDRGPFNEAPAERGGKRRKMYSPGRPLRMSGFNEAPAERGGKRRDDETP